MPAIFFIQPEDIENFNKGEWVLYDEEQDHDRVLIEIKMETGLETKTNTNWLSDQLVDFESYVRLKTAVAQ